MADYGQDKLSPEDSAYLEKAVGPFEKNKTGYFGDSSPNRTWPWIQTEKIIFNNRLHITDPEEIKKLEAAYEKCSYTFVFPDRGGVRKVIDLSHYYEQFYRKLPFMRRHPVFSMGMAVIGGAGISGIATYCYIFGNLFRRK